MSEQPRPAVFVGLDVGKSEHHAVAVTTAGKTVYDKALPNGEARLRNILEELATIHGPPRAYYVRKRAQGQRHDQAIIALARRPRRTG